MPPSLRLPSVLTWSFLAVLAALAGPSAALAQDDDATRAASARALFSEGVAHADALAWEPAAEAFRRALALRSSPVIELNLAIAESHLNQLVVAAERLRSVARDPAADAEIRRSAAATLREVEPRIAWIRLRIAGSLEGCEIRIDGRTLSRELVAAPIPIDPGVHRVAVMRGPVVVTGGSVEMSEGTSHQLSLRVPARSEPASEGRMTDEEIASAVPGVTGSDVPAEALALTPSTGPDPLAVGLGVGGGIVLIGGAVALALVLALPGEAMPIPGSIGVIEVGR